MSPFPLALSLCERVMLLQHDPRYPAQFTTEVEFRGALDRDALRRTLPEALARHPLFCARIEEGRRWVLPQDRSPPEITWVEGGPPLLEPTRRAFDPAREDGIRIWCRVEEQSWTLTLEVNHLCTDGVGVVYFATDWVLAYEAQVFGLEAPRWVDSDLELLRERDQLRRAQGRSDAQDDLSVTGILREVVDFLWHRPTRLPGGALDPVPGPRLSEMRKRVLSPAQAACLRRAARAAGGTSNDILTARCFQALRRWWELRAPSRTPGWLQLMLPTNQRGLRDSRSPASNKVGWSFLGYRFETCACPDRLLQEVLVDTREIKQRELGVLIFDILGCIAMVPGLLPLLLRFPFHIASAVLSNMGRVEDIFRARIARGQGGLPGMKSRLVRVTAAPPIPPGAGVALAIVTMDSGTHVGAHFDSSLFTREMQEEFLDLVMEQLEEASAAPEPGPAGGA